MTFKNVAFKNFTSHLRRYISYFLCSSFTIMLFFIYASLYFNKSFLDYANETEFIYMVNLGVGTVFVFSIFFINYAHSAFVKSRSKEFALLMTLGLTKKNISNLILIENILILVGSLAGGLISGALFSRLFFLIISKLMREIPLKYYLDYKSFLVTTLVFVIIYGITIFITRKATVGLSIIKLMKAGREKQDKPKGIWKGILGIFIFWGSLVMILLIAPMKGFSDMGYMYLVYGTIAFTSMYFIISHCGVILMRLFRRNKDKYYKKMLSITELEYSFKQNKKIIFILSLLSAMIIFFVSSPITLLSISKEIATGICTADIQYAEFGNVNTLDQDKVNEIINSGKTSFISENTTDILLISYDGSQKNIKPVISESTYRKLNVKTIPLIQGEVLELITVWIPGYDEFKGKDHITLVSDNFKEDFNLKGKVVGKGIDSKIINSNVTLVLTDRDFDKLEKGLDTDSLGRIHQYYFKNWKKTDSIAAAFRKNLQNTSEQYPVDSLMERYRITKHMFSMMIFFTSFMGLLFFISSGSILLFKQYGETEYFRSSYKKLSQIGLTKKELMKTHAFTQRWVYFTPLFFGFFIGFAFIYMTNYIMSAGDTQNMIGNFFRNSIIITVIYGMIQLIYYMVSMSRFKKSVFQS